VNSTGRMHRSGGARPGCRNRDRDEPFEALVGLIARLERRLGWRRAVLVVVFGGIVGGLLDPRLAICGGAVAVYCLAGDVGLRLRLARAVGDLGSLGAPRAPAVQDWLGCLQRVSRLRAQTYWIGEPLTGVSNILRSGIGQAVAAGWRPDNRVALLLLSEARRQAADEYLAVSDDPAEMVEFLVAMLLVASPGVSSADVDVLRALATGARTERLCYAAEVALQTVMDDASPPGRGGVAKP